jgi:hypothetical protein
MSELRFCKSIISVLDTHKTNSSVKCRGGSSPSTVIDFGHISPDLVTSVTVNPVSRHHPPNIKWGVYF